MEIYAVNFFTNGSFLVPLDNGVPFHDVVALEVLSRDFKEKILLDTTYCCIQWLRDFSIKGGRCHTTLNNFPRKGRPISFFSIFSHFLCPRGVLTKQREKIDGEKIGNESDC